MYKLRRRWASVFTSNLFSAGMHATSRSEVTNKVIKDLCASSSSLFDFVTHYEQLQTDWRRRESDEDAKCRGMPGQLVENNPILTHAARVFTRYVYKMFEKEALKSINVLIHKFPTNINSDDLVFEVVSTTFPDRIRHVVLNRNSHHITCSCHKWDVKGVMCYHMFKILYLFDIREIPDSLILKRGTREAKLRHKVCVGDEHELNKNSIVSSMTFVNNVMRHTYALSQKYMADELMRAIIEEWMNELDKELVRTENRRNRKRKAKEKSENEFEDFRDPPMSFRWSLPCKRNKPNTKRKIGQGKPRGQAAKYMLLFS